MSADTLLLRLDGLKRTGQGRWIAKCPAHDDRRPSLAIRELDDGRILAHCFAQCPVADVLAAVGLTLEDLFPEPLPSHSCKSERRPFNAIDILRCVASESLIVAVAARNLAQEIGLTQDDRDRLLLAAGRLQEAVEVACHA